MATALVWLRLVDGIKLSMMDWVRAGIALLGMAIIVAGWTGEALVFRYYRLSINTMTLGGFAIAIGSIEDSDCPNQTGTLDRGHPYFILDDEHYLLAKPYNNR